MMCFMILMQWHHCTILPKRHGNIFGGSLKQRHVGIEPRITDITGIHSVQARTQQHTGLRLTPHHTTHPLYNQLTKWTHINMHRRGAGTGKKGTELQLKIIHVNDCVSRLQWLPRKQKARDLRRWETLYNPSFLLSLAMTNVIRRAYVQIFYFYFFL